MARGMRVSWEQIDEIFAPTLKDISRNTLFTKNSPQLWLLSLYVLVTSSLTLILTIKIKLNTNKSNISFILKQYSFKFMKKCAQDLVRMFHAQPFNSFSCTYFKESTLGAEHAFFKIVRFAQTKIFSPRLASQFFAKKISLSLCFAIWYLEPWLRAPN